MASVSTVRVYVRDGAGGTDTYAVSSPRLSLGSDPTISSSAFRLGEP
jgi:hypothetical protein